MKKFAFKLETVLRYRRNRYEQARDGFARAAGEYRQACDELDDTVRDEERRRDEFLERQRSELDAEGMMRHVRYLAHLAGVRRNQIRAAAERKSEMEQKRVEMVDRSRDKKIMETFKDRKRDQYMQELRRDEQKMIDESATARHMRKANMFVVFGLIFGAIILFNVVFLFMAFKSGVFRLEVGQKKVEPTLLDIEQIHEEMTRQQAQMEAEKADLEKELARIDELRQQLTVEKESLEAQKQEMTGIFDGKLGQIQEELERISLARDEFEEKRLKKLAKVYESMKPDQAVKVFEKMSVDTMTQILVRMKDRSSARIIGKMRPEMAGVVSEVLKHGKERKK
jgi:flagellar FliJ protein